MLPSRARLRGHTEFQRCVRDGVRAGSHTVVLHARVDSTPVDFRVGLIVSKRVGNAVQRNWVKRRLRHLLVEVNAQSPAPVGTTVVARALPGAASSAEQLRTDVHKAWGAVVRKLGAS